MSDIKWRLANIRARQQIGDLSVDDIVKRLVDVPERERPEWLVWRKGLPDWVRALDCEEIKKELAKIEEDEPPPLPPPFEAAAELTTKTTVNLLALTPAPSRAERRKHPRIAMKLRVVVVSGNRTFRTYTHNISKGGLLLEKRLPWQIAGEQCVVFLSDASETDTLAFKARVIANPDDMQRIAFDEPEEATAQEKLDAWLMNVGQKASKAAA